MTNNSNNSNKSNEQDKLDDANMKKLCDMDLYKTLSSYENKESMKKFIKTRPIAQGKMRTLDVMMYVAVRNVFAKFGTEMINNNDNRIILNRKIISDIFEKMSEQPSFEYEDLDSGDELGTDFNNINTETGSINIPKLTTSEVVDSDGKYNADFQKQFDKARKYNDSLMHQ